MPKHDVSALSETSAPVQFIKKETAIDKPEHGIALCLSGGGYRAMLFHLGAIWRLYETGILRKVDRISSVSGGSITAAVVGMNWNELSFDPLNIEKDFIPKIVGQIRLLAGKTIDIPSIIKGLLLPRRISDKIANSYRLLFGIKTLQDLPDKPRFVFNSTNVQSGVLWRFMKPYMRDYKVGEVKKPKIELAIAVAASSAFPPVLSPLVLKLDPESFTPNSGQDLQKKPYTNKVVLTDGGVYDNLGLETAWKRYNTVLVSDAGGGFEPKPKPWKDWIFHSYRVLMIINNQVISLRKRQLINSYLNSSRNGAYWGIRTNIKHYELNDSLICPYEKTIKLAETPTRLKKISQDLQEKLINWGYAVCDAAIRKHYDSSIQKSNDFPYPNSGV